MGNKAKSVTNFLLLGVILLNTVYSISYAVTATELPSFKNGTNVNIGTNGSQLDVKINGGKGSVGTANWNSFNVGKNASVNFQFNAKNQTALNYVDASGGMSQIYGSLTNSGTGASTGKVILLNPNGVLFGNGANINLNSFTVSTLNGTYNASTRKLTLTQNNSSGNITVKKGSKITTDKTINFISGKNITVAKGASITSKNSSVNFYTADKGNIVYKTNGDKSTANFNSNSSKVMKITIKGNVSAKDVNIVNKSTNKKSSVNFNKTAIKSNQIISELGSKKTVITNGKTTLSTDTVTINEYDNNGKIIKTNTIELESNIANFIQTMENELRELYNALASAVDESQKDSIQAEITTKIMSFNIEAQKIAESKKTDKDVMGIVNSLNIQLSNEYINNLQNKNNNLNTQLTKVSNIQAAEIKQLKTQLAQAKTQKEKDEIKTVIEERENYFNTEKAKINNQIAANNLTIQVKKLNMDGKSLTLESRVSGLTNAMKYELSSLYNELANAVDKSQKDSIQANIDTQIASFNIEIQKLIENYPKSGKNIKAITNNLYKELGI